MKSSQGKSPYEIRADLLDLSFRILQNQHSVNLDDNGHATTSPTTEEVVKEAEKLNDFVSTPGKERSSFR